MIRIAPDVLAAWHAVSDEADEPSLTFLLSGPSSPQALSAVEMALGDLHETYPLERQPFLGEWRWTQGRGGVIFEVTEAEDFEASLRTLAELLPTHGIPTGRIELYRQPRVPRRVNTAHLLECRMRVQGTRVRHGERNFGWHPDPAALAETAKAAVDWCLDAGRRGELALDLPMLPSVLLLPTEDVHARVASEMQRLQLVQLRTACAESSMRCVALHAQDGRITLIETLADPGAWEKPLANLKAPLATAADSLVYGLIKHGSHVNEAALGGSLKHDWPWRPGIDPTSWPNSCARAFEDVAAPDAFAVQLLGSGYAGRLEAGAPWRRTEIAPNAVLLEHERPEEWFGTEFLPFGSDSRTASITPSPPVLAKARASLAPLLITNDTWTHHSST